MGQALEDLEQANIFCPFHRVVFSNQQDVIFETGFINDCLPSSDDNNTNLVNNSRRAELIIGNAEGLEVYVRARSDKLDFIELSCVSVASASKGSLSIIISKVVSAEVQKTKRQKTLWSRSRNSDLAILRRDFPLSHLPSASRTSASNWLTVPNRFSVPCNLQVETGAVYRIRIEFNHIATINHSLDVNQSPGVSDKQVKLLGQVVRAAAYRDEGIIMSDYDRSYIRLGGIQNKSARYSTEVMSTKSRFIPLFEIGRLTSPLEITQVVHLHDELLKMPGMLRLGEATLLNLGAFEDLEGLCQIRLKLSDYTHQHAHDDYDLSGYVDLFVSDEDSSNSDHLYNVRTTQVSVKNGWLNIELPPIRNLGSQPNGRLCDISLVIEVVANHGDDIFIDGFNLEGEGLRFVTSGKQVVPGSNLVRPPSYISAIGYFMPHICGYESYRGMITKIVGWYDGAFYPYRYKLYDNERFETSISLAFDNLSFVEFAIYNIKNDSDLDVQIDRLDQFDNWQRLIQDEDFTLFYRDDRCVITFGSTATRIVSCQHNWLRISLGAPGRDIHDAIEIVINEVPLNWAKDYKYLSRHDDLPELFACYNQHYEQVTSPECWRSWGEVRLNSNIANILPSFESRLLDDNESAPSGNNIRELGGSLSRTIIVIDSGREDPFFNKLISRLQECSFDIVRHKSFSKEFYKDAASCVMIVLGECDFLGNIAQHLGMLQHFGIPVVEVGGDFFRSQRSNLVRVDSHGASHVSPYWGDILILALSDYKLASGESGFASQKDLMVWDSSKTSADLLDSLRQVLSHYCYQRWPSFGVIADYDGDEEQLGRFLSAWNDQSYMGKLEVMLFYTRLEVNLWAAIEDWVISNPSHRLDINVVNNFSRRKLSIVRNKALKASQSDLILITSLRDLPVSNLIEEHAKLYTLKECDAIAGLTNSEYPVGERSYLNFRFGTSSFRRALFVDVEAIFDEDDEADDTAFIAWDAIELGIKLAARKCNFATINKPLLVSDSTGDCLDRDLFDSLSGLKELYRLTRRYPDFEVECHGWIANMFGDFITQDNMSAGCPSRESVKLNSRYSQKRTGDKGYGLHLSDNVQRIALAQAPSPYLSTLRLAGHDLVTLNDSRLTGRSISNDFDMAIIEIDEYLLCPFRAPVQNSWRNFERVLRLIDALGDRVVFVLLGNPLSFGSQSGDAIEEDCRLRDFLENQRVICPSYESFRQWGFADERSSIVAKNVIWPGFDCSEFGRTNYERLILSHDAFVFNDPERYGGDLLNEIISSLPKGEIVYCLNGDKTISIWQERAKVYELQRYSLFLNTATMLGCSLRLVEALLSGLIVVSVSSADVERIIENGRTGYIVDNISDMVEHLRMLKSDQPLLKRISEVSRRRACELFNHERFLLEWEQVLLQ